MTNEKYLVFDMDGTIADLYGVEGWLSDLQNENPRPYEEAEPLYDMDTLCSILGLLRYMGWKVVITSWLAKGATAVYDELVRTAKKNWLAKYNFPYDEIHLVKYGTTKADCTRKKGGYQILFDDNDKIREGWHLGKAIDAKENIMYELIHLLTGDC